jgi:hypothetical protein
LQAIRTLLKASVSSLKRSGQLIITRSNGNEHT